MYTARLVSSSRSIVQSAGRYSPQNSNILLSILFALPVHPVPPAPLCTSFLEFMLPVLVHLFPVASLVILAVGRLPELNVYGFDYPTKDGTAVRDYIHVMDLADGHIAALGKIFVAEDIGCVAYNLGTGCGTSVLEMVAAFEKAVGKKIPIKLCPRRPGDATAVYASTDIALKELGWKAKYGTEEMCRDQWKWESKNPFGYKSKP